MNLPFLRRKPLNIDQTDRYLEGALDDSLSDFTLSPADRTKLRAMSARDELLEEIEELEGENLSDEADVMKAEVVITAKLDAIKKRNASIAWNKEIIAILDRTKADIDALSEPSPSAPKTTRKKARVDA